MTVKKTSSIDWLVSARGYAMYGIFFGHMVGAYYSDGYKSLLLLGQFFQIAFIPFFILLTGAFYQKPQQGFWAYSWLKFTQRILPVYFYVLLVIPFIILFSKHSIYTDVIRWLPLYLLGIPMLSWPSWYLVALFSSELFYFFVAKKLLSKKSLWLGMLAFYVVAWAFNSYKLYLPRWVEVVSMFWMVQAVPIFISIFLLGAALKKFILKLSRWPTYKVSLMLFGAYALVAPAVYFNDSFPSSKNQGLKHYISNDMPMMFIGQYGDFFLFFMSIFFGIFGFLALCRLLPVSRFMRTVGDYSLILLGLNAVFHQVLNRPLVKWIPLYEDSWYWGLAYSCGIGLVQLALSLIVAIYIGRYFPQLTGKPMLDGPILPAFYRKQQD